MSVTTYRASTGGPASRRVRTLPLGERWCLPERDVEALAGQLLDDTHWELGVGLDNVPATLVTVGGVPVLCHVRNVVPEGLCRRARCALGRLARGRAHGRACHFGHREAGADYPGPHALPAQEFLSRNLPGGWEAVLEVLYRLADGLGEVLPEQRAELEEWAARARPWVLPGVPFTSAQFNLDNRLPCHCHPGNAGWVCMACLRGAESGGEYIVPRLRLGVRLRTGDAVFASSAEWHGVGPHGVQLRQTLAAYCASGLVLCPYGRSH